MSSIPTTAVAPMEEDTNSSSFLHFPRSRFTTMVLPAIFYGVFVIGFIGNLLIVYILHRLQSGKKIADLFMTNLAVADLIFLGTLPFWATEYAMHGQWVFGRVFCKLASTCTLFSAYGSVFFLSIMALDRLGVVVFYKSYNSKRTFARGVFAVLLVWLASVTSSMLALYFRDTAEDHNGDVHCGWQFNEAVESHVTWYCVHFIMRFIIGFGLPLTITIFCYITIFTFLRQRRSKKKLLRKQQDRVTLVVLVVIVVFIICWLPNQISNFVYVAQGLRLIYNPEEPSEVQYYIHLFTTCLAWGHSCINPFLYGFMREDVRLKFAEITNACGLRCDRKWKTMPSFPERCKTTLISSNSDTGPRTQRVETDCETATKSSRV